MKTVLLALLLALPLTVCAALDDELKELQHEWAEIKYRQPPAAQEKAFAALTKTADAQAALKAAFARGLDVRRFEMKEPSLHDAFIVLTGGDR